MKNVFSGPALQAGYAGSNPAGDAIDSRQLADPATRPKIGPSNGPSISGDTAVLRCSGSVFGAFCAGCGHDYSWCDCRGGRLWALAFVTVLAAGCGAPVDPLPEAEACVTTLESTVMMLIMGIVCGTAATLSERFRRRQERVAYEAELRLMQTKLQAYTDTRIEIQEDDRV